MTSLSIVQMILSVDIVTIYLPTQCQLFVLSPVDVTLYGRPVSFGGDT